MTELTHNPTKPIKNIFKQLKTNFTLSSIRYLTPSSKSTVSSFKYFVRNNDSSCEPGKFTKKKSRLDKSIKLFNNIFSSKSVLGLE